jgi:hypothetical protein
MEEIKSLQSACRRRKRAFELTADCRFFSRVNADVKPLKKMPKDE